MTDVKSSLLRKIIWAVNVLESPEDHSHALFMLGTFSRAMSVRIEPVHVLSTPFAAVRAEPPADIEQAFQALAEKRLLELSKKSDLSNISNGKILVSRAGSIRKDVQCLIEYAEEKEVDAIVVATHARKGLSRLFLGSFTETLMLMSSIPVITVNPETKVRERISSILFPTTFDSRFRDAFERVVELAKALEARLTLFYREPVMPSYGMTPEIYRYIEQEMRERTKTAKEWQAWANHHGVPTETQLDSRPSYLASAIEEFATEKNFDLIAMATQADVTSALLMGSATRQVVRYAPCPVWVMKIEDTE